MKKKIVKNRFTEIATAAIEHMKSGRPVKYTPQTLLDKFLEYVAFQDHQPWFKKEVIKSNKTLKWKVAKISVTPPYLFGTFYVFAGITRTTFDEYRNDPKFSAVTGLIEETMRSQKFEGAAVGVYHANIIAMELGLKQKIEQESSGTITFNETKTYESKEQKQTKKKK